METTLKPLYGEQKFEQQVSKNSIVSPSQKLVYYSLFYE